MQRCCNKNLYLPKKKLKNKFTILLVFLCQFVCGQTLKGKVVDYNSSEGVPFAEIYCLETLNGVIADSTGYWELDNIINNQMTLKISASVMVFIFNPFTFLPVLLSFLNLNIPYSFIV